MTYETQLIMAIRWYGLIQDMKLYKDTTGKYIFKCSEIKKIEPIILTTSEGKRGLAPQGLRYSNFELIKIMKAIY